MGDGQTAAAANLGTALAAAQGQFRSVGKDREVVAGQYRFRYATLAAIWDVVRAPLAAQGLAVVQVPSVDPVAKTVSVQTVLIHGPSGERIECTCALPVVQPTPQGYGSIISYARRYGLSALLGVVSDEEDDDGAAGSPHAGGAKPVAPTPGTGGTTTDALLAAIAAAQHPVELAQVAAKVRATRVSDVDRAHLLAVYNDRAAALAGAK